MADDEKAVKKAADEKPKADVAAKKKADADAKKKAEEEDVNANKPKRVQVVCKGTLGPKLLKTGEITDDPEYVALLKVKGQKKVIEVK